MLPHNRFLGKHERHWKIETRGVTGPVSVFFLFMHSESMPRKSSRRRSKVRKRKSSLPRRRSKTRARRYGRTEREYGVVTLVRHHYPPANIPDITPLIEAVAEMKQKFESNTTLPFQDRRQELLTEYDRIVGNLTRKSALEDAENLIVSVNALIGIIDVHLSIVKLSNEILARIQPLMTIFTAPHIPDAELQDVVETFILPCLALMQSILSFLSTIQNAKTSEELQEGLQYIRNETERLKGYELSDDIVKALRRGQESMRDELRFGIRVSKPQSQEMQQLKEKLEQNIKLLHSFAHKVPTAQSFQSEEPM